MTPQIDKKAIEANITDLILNDFNINLKPYVKRVIKKAKNASNAKIPLSTAVSR